MKIKSVIRLLLCLLIVVSFIAHFLIIDELHAEKHTDGHKDAAFHSCEVDHSEISAEQIKNHGHCMDCCHISRILFNITCLDNIYNQNIKNLKINKFYSPNYSISYSIDHPPE